jgi:hypothetical protein
VEAACECCKARREQPSTPRIRRRFQSALCTSASGPSASPPAAAKSASDPREECSSARGDILFRVWRQADRRRARFSACRRWDSLSGQSVLSARPPAEFVDALRRERPTVSLIVSLFVLLLAGAAAACRPTYSSPPRVF